MRLWTVSPARGCCGTLTDFSLADAINTKFKNTCNNKKVVLRPLKDCFTNYINKLCFLEEQNKILVVDEPLKGQGKAHLGDL